MSARRPRSARASRGTNVGSRPSRLATRSTGIPCARNSSAIAPTGWQASIVDATDDEVLAAISLQVDSGEVQAACARIARRIHTEKLRVVGFVPSDDRVAVPPVLVHLGLALCDLTGGTVAVVDANVRYPGLPEIAHGQRTDRDDSVFTTRWLRGSLALLSPPPVERAGKAVPQLGRVLLGGID